LNNFLFFPLYRDFFKRSSFLLLSPIKYILTEIIDHNITVFIDLSLVLAPLNFTDRVLYLLDFHIHGSSSFGDVGLEDIAVVGGLLNTPVTQVGQPILE
jgi:hypothetical protein